MFINEQSDVIPSRELDLCFEETVGDLELAGIHTGCYSDIGKEIPAKVAAAIYDCYENICEEVYGSVNSMLIRIYREEEDCVLSMDVTPV